MMTGPYRSRRRRAVRKELPIEHGLACHLEGHSEEAAAIYRRILERHPDCGDAAHLLGVLENQQGNFALAAILVAQAIRLQPGIAAYHCTLGDIMQAQGARPQACLCYEEALRLDPAFVPALVNGGGVLHALHRYEEASVAYWRAIQLQPDCADAFDNLGNTLRAQGRGEDAIVCHRRALELRPENPRTWVNLAASHMMKGLFALAEECARHALTLQPKFPEALSNLSVALLHQNRHAEAEAACRDALAERPAAAYLHSNLGNTLIKQGRVEAAELSLLLALKLEPDQPEATHNMGIILRMSGRLEEAGRLFESAVERHPDAFELWTDLGALRLTEQRLEAACGCFDRALEIHPSYAQGHLSRALCKLLTGEFAEGLEEYEWRLQCFDRPPRALAYPAWNGTAAEGKTILLFAEQGLGDVIQFARYAPLVASRGARVIAECPPGLKGLLGSVEGISQVIDPVSELPPFDYQASFMSLPRLLGTTREEIPATVPYLHVKGTRREAWQERLGPKTGLRVGVFWSGNPENAYDCHRSIPFERLEPLAGVRGIEWHSLQLAGQERTKVAEDAGWLSTTLPCDSDIDDLAAVISLLDLTISIDSMPAHLAGALARPVWLLTPFTPDWRWQLEREDSPWYPTMRLFRQPAFGDWDSVVMRVFEELSSMAVQVSRNCGDKQE